MDHATLWIHALPLLGALLGLLCLAASFRQGRRRRLVDNLPTSKTTGVFIGLVELKGTAEAEQPLASYLAGTACVQYGWRIDEHWSRMVTETYTDKNGKTQTRTRQESGWTAVGQGGETIAFYLRDDCGVILIRPEGAKVETLPMFDQTCGRADPLYYGKGPATALADSDHRRRFSEWGIPLHAPLYVLGQARERQDLVAAEIARDPQAPMFLISTRTEEQVSRGLGWGQWLWTVLGGVLWLASLVIRDHLLDLDLGSRWPWYVAAGAGYLVATGLAWCWMVFNSLIELRNRVRQAWSQVEVQLKRRYDLIQGFRDYERNLQTELAQLRAQLQATPPGVAGPDYQAVAGCALAIRERYPELKASEVFETLSQNLIDTEQRMALARGYFNEIATHYNTRLETVPERFIAQLARLQPQTLMAAGDFERAPVQVKLSGV
jgi:hypothetical protein